MNDETVHQLCKQAVAQVIRFTFVCLLSRSTLYMTNFFLG